MPFCLWASVLPMGLLFSYWGFWSGRTPCSRPAMFFRLLLFLAYGFSMPCSMSGAGAVQGKLWEWSPGDYNYKAVVNCSLPGKNAGYVVFLHPFHWPYWALAIFGASLTKTVTAYTIFTAIPKSFYYLRINLTRKTARELFGAGLSLIGLPLKIDSPL